MTDEEKKLREQIKEEMKGWIKEEYHRRFEEAKKSLEQQGQENIEHVRKQGIGGEDEIAAQTQMSIGFARTEILKEVEFDAFHRVEEELKKRLKEKKR